MCSWAVLCGAVYSFCKWCDFDTEHCMSDLFNAVEPPLVITLWKEAISSLIYDYVLKFPKLSYTAKLLTFCK